MSQAQTLQDIYSKIADIYDKFCELLQGEATRGDYITFNASKILAIPIDATHLIIKSSGFPNYISKRFDQNINKSLIQSLGQAQPDLSKYTGSGLSSVSFGLALNGQITTKDVFWTEDKKIEYASQIVEIPQTNYSNLDKFAYVYLKESMLVTVSYLK